MLALKAKKIAIPIVKRVNAHIPRPHGCPLFHAAVVNTSFNRKNTTLGADTNATSLLGVRKE